MQILFSVTESLNELCAWICGIVYQLIAKIYEKGDEASEIYASSACTMASTPHATATLSCILWHKNLRFHFFIISQSYIRYINYSFHLSLSQLYNLFG